MSTSKKATRRRKSEKVPESDLRAKKVRPAQERPEERDFTGGGIFCLPARQGTTGDPIMDEEVVRLVVDWDCGQYEPYLVEMIITVLKLGREDLGIADLKLFSRALREMRASSKMFRQYTHRPKIAIFGSARTQGGEPEYLAAQAFAQRMEEAGFMTITGAGDGIMGAAQKGAGREASFGLNIKLPFEQSANDTIAGDDKLVTFNYFFTRKLAFVKESDAVALFPGGFGTMDEGFEVLTLMQTGKAQVFPIVMLEAPGGTYWKSFLQFIRDHLLRRHLISEDDLKLFRLCHSVDEAVEEVCRFYRLFHSYRFVGHDLVIRLKSPLTEAFVEELDRDFCDLLQHGSRFQLSRALPEEDNEIHLKGFQRLVFRMHRGKNGRLRELIDRINLAPLAS
ncbi:MAG: LOG family protein [Verrucomicrobiales bacterium]|nr:LOG family protein [Verrucomicrobiales bacterium]